MSTNVEVLKLSVTFCSEPIPSSSDGTAAFFFFPFLRFLAGAATFGGGSSSSTPSEEFRNNDHTWNIKLEKMLVHKHTTKADSFDECFNPPPHKKKKLINHSDFECLFTNFISILMMMK